MEENKTNINWGSTNYLNTYHKHWKIKVLYFFIFHDLKKKR